MNIGKAPENVLKRSVLKKVEKYNRNIENTGKPGVGVDADFYTIGGEKFATNVATVFGNEIGNGKLAFARAYNSLAAAGVKGEFASISLVVSSDAGEEKVKALMDEILQEAEQKGTAIVSGNTIFSEQETVVTVTLTGRNTCLIADESVKAQYLVMFGMAGNSGASMLAQSRIEALRAKYTKDFLQKAVDGFDKIDISGTELALLENEKEIVALHDVSEGGVLGAAWELCERLGLGCEIDIFDIPVKQAVIEVCEFLDINPYILRGDGAFLAAVAGDREKALEIAERYGGKLIGSFNQSQNRILHINEEIRQMEPNRYEEYYRAKNK